MITYIQLISDYTQLLPGVCELPYANRLAMEIVDQYHGRQGKERRLQARIRYKDSLNSAEAQNECLDFSPDEDGFDVVGKMPAAS